MADHSTRTDASSMTSPWPILVAVGLVCAEVGIVLDLFPVAVGGLLLLVYSLTGILSESGYLSRARSFATGLGAVLAAVGFAMYAVGMGAVAADSGLDALIGLDSRGLAIAVAGVLTAFGALVGPRLPRP